MARNVKQLSSALSNTNRAIDNGMLLLDGLQNVVAGLGTDRDKSSFSTYAPPRMYNQPELDAIYRTSWLAKRIINAIADDMTREWRTTQFDDSTSEEQNTIEKAENRLRVRPVINEALRWSRLYGGALVVIGTRNCDKEMHLPLIPESIRKGDLTWLRALDRWRVSPDATLTTDLSSRNFGLPEYYTVAESSVRIHHSRVLRFNGQRVPYFTWNQTRWDDSELLHVMDSVTNVDTSSKAIGTMLFEANVDVIKSEGMADMMATKNGSDAIIKRYQLAATMKSFNRMLLLDGKETYEKKGNTFTNLDKIWLQFMVDVCGAADIPMTRLFGQSAAGLNATGDNDIRNYYDMISAKQESDLRPQLEYLDEILIRSELGSIPESYQFDFNSLWQVSDKEKADIQKTNAERDKVYLEAGVVTEGLVARELKEAGTYLTITDEDVELAEELAEASEEDRKIAGEDPDLIAAAEKAKAMKAAGKPAVDPASEVVISKGA